MGNNVQLLLPVTFNRTQTFSSFVEDQNLNGLLVSELTRALTSDDFSAHFIAGNNGVGCSHLLNAVCHFADTEGKTSMLLPLDQVVSASPDIIEGLDNVDVVCIDDIQVLEGKLEWQTAIFNLFNQLHQSNAKIIFAGHKLPTQLQFELKDLLSRLQWCTIFQLQELNEELKIKALIQHAHLMEFEVSVEVAKFIIHRLPRNMIILMQALDTVAKQSIAMKRVVTVPFVKEVLGI